MAYGCTSDTLVCNISYTPDVTVQFYCGFEQLYFEKKEVPTPEEFIKENGAKKISEAITDTIKDMFCEKETSLEGILLLIAMREFLVHNCPASSFYINNPASGFNMFAQVAAMTTNQMFEQSEKQQ